LFAAVSLRPPQPTMTIAAASVENPARDAIGLLLDRPGANWTMTARRGQGLAPIESAAASAHKGRMIRQLASLAVAPLLLSGCGGAEPARAPSVNGSAVVQKAAPPAPHSDRPRLAIETQAGRILVELDARRAPVTAANFLAYADQHRFDGTFFYRASRTRGAADRGFIQGGIRHDYRRMLAPIAHEPTSRTGLRHRDGTISMAHSETSGAMGDFFITVGAMPSMDAHGREPGFAAFGHVVEGMDVVRHILAAPTLANAGSGAMRGQMVAAPVPILSVRRAD